MAGSHGAGRFLPQDFSAYQSMIPQEPQQPTAGQPGMAYQPNYSMFWNPTSMLGLGNPQFTPPWYSQVGAPQPPAPAAPPAPAPQSRPTKISDIKITLQDYLNRKNMGFYPVGGIDGQWGGIDGKWRSPWSD